MEPYQASPLEGLAPSLSRRMDVHESTQGRQYRTVIIVLCFVPPAIVLRCISRCLHRMPFSWDDWTLLLGTLLGFTAAAFVLLGIHSGVGRHVQDLPPQSLVLALKTLYAFEISDALCLAFLKCSVLFLLYRIFPTKAMRIGLTIVGILVAGWFIPTIIVGALQCNPPAKQWNPTLPGTCVNSRAYMLGGGVAHFVTDIFILVLPVKPILDLHVSLGRKLLIAFAFLSGIFTAAVSIYRLIAQLEYTETDATFTIADAMSWCIVEICAAIVSCCLPTLMPLIKYCFSRSNFRRKLFAKTNNTWSYGSTGASGRCTKASATDPNDDFEQPLAVSGSSKNTLPDEYSWETHSPKGDEALSERRASSSITKSPKVHEPDPASVEMDDIRGIRVMQEVDVINHKS